MAAASIDGINIKIGADLTDLKDQMGETTTAIKGVSTAAETDLKKAATPVDTLKKKFVETSEGARQVAQACSKIASAIGKFTSGVFEEALKISPLTAASWNGVSEALTNIKEAIAIAIGPEIQTISKALTDMLNGVANFIKEHPEVAKDIMGLAVAIGVVASVLSTTIPLALAFGTSVATITWPVLLVIAVIILVIYTIAHWGEICDWFKEKWEVLKDAISVAIDAIKTKFDEWKTKVNTAKANLISFKQSVVDKFSTIKTDITEALKGIDLIQAGKDFVSSVAEGIKQGIASAKADIQAWFLSLIPDGVKEYLGLGGGGDTFDSNLTTGQVTPGEGGGGSGSRWARAGGGPVSGGHPYIVGEVGPEIFVPHTSGYIVPNDQVDGFGQTVNVYVGNVYGENYLRDVVADTLSGVVRREMRLGA